MELFVQVTLICGRVRSATLLDFIGDGNKLDGVRAKVDGGKGCRVPLMGVIISECKEVGDPKDHVRVGQLVDDSGNGRSGRRGDIVVVE